MNCLDPWLCCSDAGICACVCDAGIQSQTQPCLSPQGTVSRDSTAMEEACACATTHLGCVVAESGFLRVRTLFYFTCTPPLGCGDASRLRPSPHSLFFLLFSLLLNKSMLIVHIQNYLCSSRKINHHGNHHMH
jgi:hypothetical protein